MKTQDKLLSPNEVSHFLEIGSSTLRKWCIALEEQHYNFMRTEQKKRLFTEKDLFVLNNFKTLVKDKNLSINVAAEIMSNKYKDDIVFSDETEESHLPEHPEQNTSELSRQLEHMQTEIEQLKDLNRTLLVKLDEQYEYIKERDQRVLEALQESKENKQLLLEMKEEQLKQNKKGWKNWFKRD
ncbi:MerR family transcriptional regulator [Clostridioides difficile]|uniref:MerR family transcriptional regulator n=1 Tax=Clostridioides difficile TaxID=1496 RepID=UPI000C9BE55A|nr:MerR family transcriptional regulator [Clostridioides difficile]